MYTGDMLGSFPLIAMLSLNVNGNIEMNKTEAAKQQLIQAVKCFFNDESLISVHTLAAASRQLLSDLCKLKGVKSDLEQSPAYQSLDKQTKKKLNLAIREPQNFLKHADKDPEGILTYNAKLTELLIHDACQLFRSLEGKLFHEGTVFQCWMYKKYPDDFGGFSPEIDSMPEASDMKEYLKLVNKKDNN